eukprot:TRINITY_DN10531_c0_g1_i2.p1 TRINITY_DN10531_c0_g1~~TRINITY_DN10531_c0_g1_i2.p1  ORF type:complete len:1061 (-),score=238.64 TRINITY_DN10531_c0_g1_i2:553-3735(-)
MKSWGAFAVPDLLSQTLRAVERGMDNIGLDLGENAQNNPSTPSQAASLPANSFAQGEGSHVNQSSSDETKTLSKSFSSPNIPKSSTKGDAQALASSATTSSLGVLKSSSSVSLAESHDRMKSSKPQEVKQSIPSEDAFFGSFGIDEAKPPSQSVIQTMKRQNSTAKSAKISQEKPTQSQDVQPPQPKQKEDSHRSPILLESDQLSLSPLTISKSDSISDLLKPEKEQFAETQTTTKDESEYTEMQVSGADSLPSLPTWEAQSSDQPVDDIQFADRQDSLIPQDPLVAQILSQRPAITLEFLDHQSDDISDGMSPLKEKQTRLDEADPEKQVPPSPVSTRSGPNTISTLMDSLVSESPLSIVSKVTTEGFGIASFLPTKDASLQILRDSGDEVANTHTISNDADVDSVSQSFNPSDERMNAQTTKEKVPVQSFTASVEQLVTLHEKIANLSAEIDEAKDALKQRDHSIEQLLQELKQTRENAASATTRAADAEMARGLIQQEMTSMKKEFSDRLSSYERKMQTAIREKESLKKEQGTSEEFLAQLRKKEEECQLLRKEGDQLSKKICTLETIIKKQRSELTDSEGKIEAISKNLQSSESKIETLNEKIKKLESNETELKGLLGDREGVAALYARQLNEKTRDLEISQAKLKELTESVALSSKLYEDVQKMQLISSEKAEAAMKDAETRARDEVTRELKKVIHDLESRESSLIATVADLRSTITRITEQAAWREENFRKEIHDLRERYTQSERRYEELVATVPNSTRPLLRQIENLQKMIDTQTESASNIQRSLNEALQQAHDELVTVKERQNEAQTRAVDLASKLSILDTQLVTTRSENSRYTSEIQSLQSKIEEYEANASKLRHEIAGSHIHESDRIRNLQQQLEKVQNELIAEREQSESIRLRLLQEKEDISSKLRRNSIENAHGNTSAEAFSAGVTMNGGGQLDSKKLSVVSLLSTPTSQLLKSQPSNSATGDIFDAVVRGTKLSQSFALRGLVGTSTLPAAILEEIESYLKLKEGEINALQQRISAIETDRDALANELVSLTSRNEELYPSLLDCYN